MAPATHSRRQRLVRRPAYWDYVKGYEPGDSQYQQYYGRMEDVWLDKR